MSLNVGSLFAQLGLNTAAFTASLKQAELSMAAASTKMSASMAKVSASMMAAGATMRKTGKMMSIAMTLPLTLIGVAAYKLQKDFEASMSKIVGLVGIAKDQVDAWGKDILEMAPRLGKAPKELADALFFVTSAGIRGAEAMEVLEMSAKASASGLGETKIVADLVTSAMNAYGKENLSAANATDILTATVREGKAEATDLAQAMGQVLPIASEMGVSFDQVGAAVAGMTRTGTNATTAAMQLKQMLNSMLKPSNQAEDALSRMGTSSAELRKQIEEEGLLAVMERLRVLTHSNSNEMAQIFPNIRALSGILDLMGKNAEGNAEIFNALSDSTGAADKAFQAASETAEFKLNQSISAVKTTLTEFGDTLKGPVSNMLEKVTKKLEKVAGWFRNLSDAQKQSVLKFAAVAAGIGPVIFVLGGMATSIGKVTRAIGIMRASMVKAGGALNWFKTGPVVATIAAIALITTALIVWSKKMSTLSEEQKEFNNLTKNAATSILAETNQLKALVTVADDETRSKESRIAALETLKKMAPDYFGNLDLEKGKIEGLEEASEAYTESLIRRAKVQAAEKLLIKNQEKILKLQEKAADEAAKQLPGVDVLSASLNAKSMLRVKNILKEITALENLNKSYSGIVAKAAVDDIVDGTPPGGTDEDPDYTPPGVPDEDAVNKAREIAEKIRALQNAVHLTGINEQIEAEQVRYEKEVAAAERNDTLLKLLKADHLKKIGELQDEYMKQTIADAKKAEADANAEHLRVETEMANEEYLIKAYGLNTYIEYAKSGYTDFYKWLEDKRKEDAEKEAEGWKGKATKLNEYLQLASQAISAISSMQQASKEKELAAAGDNEKKKEAIQKKYFEKEKGMAIAQALINGALAVTNMIASVPGSVINPATWVGIALAGVTTMAQIAAISSASFAKGGMVTGKTLATVGDNPSGKEAIIPFERMGEFLNSALQNVSLNSDLSGVSYSGAGSAGKTQKQTMVLSGELTGKLDGTDIIISAQRIKYRRDRVG